MTIELLTDDFKVRDVAHVPEHCADAIRCAVADDELTIEYQPISGRGHRSPIVQREVISRRLIRVVRA